MQESNILGVSIRSIIAFVVIVALCWCCIYQIDDTKVGILKDIAIMILSFYFGQRTATMGSTSTTGTTTTTEAPKTGG